MNDATIDTAVVDVTSSTPTTSEDVDRTKPEPDLISVAPERVGGTAGLVIGDSVWDVRAAGCAGRSATPSARAGSPLLR